ncbi:hypothetical protein WA026_013790 [Henosepilachna vigintioctopunctata]|uniref:Uncharacterized protein n=1 Tax=Henosepilachna vigintioctopunctata TaxID=420089 RepID=A0AAW1V218_9CUCU
MSCRVCKDPASGGNFESCSYTSAPKPDKYAYVSEKNYNSNDDPQSANEEGESKNVPVNADISSSSQKNIPKSKSNTKESRNGKQINNRESRHKNTKGSESKQHDHIYSQQSDKEDAENEQNENTESSDGAESRQETENAENENQEESDDKQEASEDESPYSEIGEYKFKYFPEFSFAKSEQEEPLDYEASSRKEVEDVLADFKKRDRSQCQQTKKNGMTCFYVSVRIK